MVGADLDVMRRDAADGARRPAVRADLADRGPGGDAGAGLGAPATAGAGLSAMLSDVLIVASPGRAPRIECAGGVAAPAHRRRHRAPGLGGGDARWAGTPSAFRVVVERRRRAPVAQCRGDDGDAGRRSPWSRRASWELEVEGRLDLDPQPTIVAGAARHVTSTRLTLRRRRQRAAARARADRQIRRAPRLLVGLAARRRRRHAAAAAPRRARAPASVTDDELGAPRACVSELRYPETEFDGAGTMLELAAGGCLATWQGERLTARG